MGGEISLDRSRSSLLSEQLVPHNAHYIDNPSVSGAIEHQNWVGLRPPTGRWVSSSQRGPRIYPETFFRERSDQKHFTLRIWLLLSIPPILRFVVRGHHRSSATRGSVVVLQTVADCRATAVQHYYNLPMCTCDKVFFCVSGSPIPDLEFDISSRMFLDKNVRIFEVGSRGHRTQQRYVESTAYIHHAHGSSEPAAEQEPWHDQQRTFSQPQQSRLPPQPSSQWEVGRFTPPHDKDALYIWRCFVGWVLFACS